MKKLVFAATVAACAIATPALTFRAAHAENRAAVDLRGDLGKLQTETGRKVRLDGGPSTSDPHPPGALFLSSPSGSDAQGGMFNPPVDLRKRSAVIDDMRSSSVRLNAPNRMRRGPVRRHPVGPGYGY